MSVTQKLTPLLGPHVHAIIGSTYQNVIIITTPKTPLKNVAIIIALGSWSEASLSSSWRQGSYQK